MFNSEIFKTIQQFIENEIEGEIKKEYDIKDLEHNHPPLRFKVENCPYCEKYGNIFEIIKIV